jgi:hypothetical protein
LSLNAIPNQTRGGVDDGVMWNYYMSARQGAVSLLDCHMSDGLLFQRASQQQVSIGNVAALHGPVQEPTR